ncbi:MAG TPA: hypothetical protein VF597_03645 [Candidatus Saccharimonadales bacterium]|jgi:hypothetical protein
MKNPQHSEAGALRPATVDYLAQYENNPFMLAVHGIDLFFKRALPVAIAVLVLAALNLASSGISSIPTGFSGNDNQPTPSTETAAPASGAPQSVLAASDTNALNSFMEFIRNVPAWVWATIAIVGLLVLILGFFISVIYRGVLDVTAARLAKGQTTDLSEAFGGLFRQFWAYAWLRVIVGVKVFLWSLLLIIPGFIMSVRYSLAGTAFFSDGLRGNAAIARSSALTKGAWLTTYASQNILNLISGYAVAGLIQPGANALLFRQLTDVEGDKPKAHLLSWLTLIVPIVLVLIGFALIAGLILVVLANMPTAP